MENVHVVNKSMKLAECSDKWTLNEEYGCYCLEDILYTPVPKAAKFQRMSIFVPQEYMKEENGAITVKPEGMKGKYTAATAPVVFENNASGYAEMEHTFLGGPRNYAGQYLERGMIYVSCGCRGRQSKNEDNIFIGKSPATLVDFKTAIRMLRHNSKVLPGNMEHLVIVGWSAGGAMSALLGCTGNSPLFDEYLEENGAFMEERDDAFAAQVYCPIIDLERADFAYEWQFIKDDEYEPSPFGPGGKLDDFQKALSQKFSQRFIQYFNDMKLVNPENGEALILGEDGRSGSGYEYLMQALEESASVYLTKLSKGEFPVDYSVEQYIAGDYTYQTVDVAALMKMIAMMEAVAGDENAPDEAIEGNDGEPGRSTADNGGADKEFEGHGKRMKMPEIPMKTMQGDAKEDWLSWDGTHAKITSLDDYLLGHRGRMKTCPSFDFLDYKSGENQLFGDENTDLMHFNPETADMIAELKEAFPKEYEEYYKAYSAVQGDAALLQRCYLINPYNYIGTEEACTIAPHFRINVGAQDADTSFMMSMILALKLKALDGVEAQYHLYWDQPHCEADYPGEACDWIESIVERS